MGNTCAGVSSRAVCGGGGGDGGLPLLEEEGKARGRYKASDVF